MKIFLIAVIFLGLGYVLAMFFPPETTGLGDYAESAQAMVSTAAVDNGTNTSSSASTITNTYDPGSFLTQSSLLLPPGAEGPIALIPGKPMSDAEVTQLQEQLAEDEEITTQKARFLTANNKQTVILFVGSYADRDTANSDLRKLKENYGIRFITSYLPNCAQAPKVDDDGFICGVEESDDVPPDQKATSA
jgi:hypothetical protein